MPESSADTDTRGRSRLIRWIALLIILGISSVLGLLHQHYRDGLFFVVGVDALCPFAGVEVLWSYISSGAFIKRTALSSIILLIGSVAAAFMMSRSFCGQICPLGTLQELFARVGIRFTGRRLEMPPQLDLPGRYLKYVVLFFVTYLTWRTATLVIRPYDPWAAYHHLTSTSVFTEFAVGLIVLLASLGASMFFDRFFCKYLCPMGALLALISRISWLRIYRSEPSCTSCLQCDEACPVNIEVSGMRDVRDPECIACNECVNACPSGDTLIVADRTGRRVSPLIVTMLTLSIFFGLVAITTATNAFAWTTEPGRGDGGGDHGLRTPVGAGGAQDSNSHGPGPGNGSGEIIRGKTTMNEVAEMSGIPPIQLQAEFGLSTSQMDMPLNEVTDALGFSMSEVRAYVDAEAR